MDLDESALAAPSSGDASSSEKAFWKYVSANDLEQNPHVSGMWLPLFAGHANFPCMRFYIFLVGSCILGTSAAAHYLLPRQQAFEFLEGALKLGGGILICGVFSLKMKWHGIIGAGILALLGAARGLGNLPGFFKFLTGDRSRDTAPLLELGVTVFCLLLLIKVVRVLFQERLRRMLESED